MKFSEIKAGSTFTVINDGEDVAYELNADGSVDAEGMETMSPEMAAHEFAGADCRVIA